MNPQRLRGSFAYLVIVVAIIAIFLAFFQPSYRNENIPISEVVEMAQAELLSKIVVNGDKLTITTRDGETFDSRKETGASMVAILNDADVNTSALGVQVVVKGSSGVGSLFGVFLSLLPIIFIGGLLYFMMRQAQSSGSQTMNFGRSKARVFIGTRPSTTFLDVAGEDEAKAELEEVVEFLRYPERFTALGAHVPRGVLLAGPPGTGKTLLAKAVAGEAAVPFFSISGSEFVEMFVGVGAARVRDLFDQAKKNSPCLIFVDEIDAVGRHRGAGLGGGHDEREQTLNQILVEMDGFETGTNVIILAATNRPDILDPALLRPGRFDRRVLLDLPDTLGRTEILRVHSKGKPVDAKVDMNNIAKQTSGFSGADLANLVNEAAILAARQNKTSVGPDEFGEAIDRVIAGPERKSRVISKHEKDLTAYHEAGHALVAHLLPHADLTHKISVIARGAMGGYTRFVPDEERHMGTKEQFESMLAVAMGGRISEQITFGDITTGASNDFEQATRIARNMVTKFAMADTQHRRPEEIGISTLMDWARKAKIKSIDVFGDDLLITSKQGNQYRSRKEPESNMLESLERAGVSTGIHGVTVNIKSSTGLGILGPRTFGRRDELVFLGKEISEQRDYSDKVAEAIDEHVHSLIDTAYNKAFKLLETNRAKLDQMAHYLVRFESVEGEELEKLFAVDPTLTEEEVATAVNGTRTPQKAPRGSSTTRARAPRVNKPRTRKPASPVPAS